MSPDEQALLATIWDSPLEDAPRLVYADWLQETNTPENIARAEFIRVQCELAKLDSWELRARELMKKASELQVEFDSEQLEMDPEESHIILYLRGFPEPRISNLHQDPFRYIQSQYWVAPTWNVDLYFNTTWGPLIENRDLFRRIRRLSPYRFFYEEQGYDITADEISTNTAAIIEAICCPEWTCLQDLSLDFPLNESTIDQLLTSPNLSQIEVLRIWSGLISPTALGRFFGSVSFPQLKRLVLSRVGAEGDTLRVLSTLPFPSLTSFELHAYGLTDQAVSRLCECGFLGQLKELLLPHNRMTLYGFECLAKCSALSGLKSLRISDDDLELNGLKLLLDSPHLQNLELLRTFTRDQDQLELAESLCRPRFGDRVEILFDDSIPF